MTDDQRLEMIDNQLELMESICAAFIEGDELQDVGNIRAIYEEYSEWFDARNSEDEEYITAWCPRLSDCAGSGTGPRGAATPPACSIICSTSKGEHDPRH